MSQNNGKKYISSALQLINLLFAISPLPLNVVRSFFANVDEILVALTYLVYTPVFMEIILLLRLQTTSLLVKLYLLSFDC